MFLSVNNISGAVPPSSMSEASPGPGPAFSENPAHQLSDISIREHHHPHQLRLIQDIGIGITGIALLLLILLVLLIRKKSKQLDSTDFHVEKTPQDIHSSGRKYQEGQLPMFRRFTYKETKKATGNFSSIIGRGGFGTVYKARFSGGFVAAVKRMNKSPCQGEDEFCKEVDLLGRLHHRHLVALKGFSIFIVTLLSATGT